MGRRRFLCRSEAGWASEEAASRCWSTLPLSTPLQNLPPLPAFVSHSSFRSLRRSIPLPVATGTIMLRLSCKPLALEGWSQEKLTPSEGGVSELAFLCSSLIAKSLLSLLPFSTLHAGILLLRPVSPPREGLFLQHGPSGWGSLLCLCQPRDEWHRTAQNASARD